MIKRPMSSHLVRFADCDPMGHLNSAKYLEYFIHAREDHLKDHYNIDLFAYTAQTGRVWMLIKNQISYYREAKLMEPIWIQSRLISITDKMSKIEMLMFNNDKTQIKSHMWVDFIHYDVRNKTVVNHTDEIQSRFKVLLDPVAQSDFESRTNHLRNRLPKDAD
jgi:acyl-CoA thioester hydrolase